MRTELPGSSGSRPAHPLSQRSPPLRKIDIAIKLKRPIDIGPTGAPASARDTRHSLTSRLKMSPQPQADHHLSLPEANSLRSRSGSERSDRSDDSSDRFERESSSHGGSEPGKRPTRKRASKPKVRTGCISCKKRHVKCDERKPHCARCENIGNLCEGYAPPKAPKPVSRADRLLLPRPKPTQLAASRSTGEVTLQPGDGSVPLLVSPNYGFEIGDDDSWYFTLFRDQIVHDLSPCHESNFWVRSSLRDSMTMRFIRHSILSIGAYARALVDLKNDYPWISAVDRPWWPASVVNRHHQAALSHHAKALSYLRQDIKSNGVDSRTTMAATLLFIVFENMQGNYHAAGSLVRSGIKVLNNLGRLKGSSFHWQAYCESFEPPDEIDEMAHMFSRHSISTVNTPFPHGKSAYHMLLDNANLDDDDENVFIEYSTQSSIPRTLEHGRVIFDTLLPSLGGFYVKALWHNLNSSYDFDEGEMAGEQAVFLSKLQSFGSGLAVLAASERDDVKLRGLDFLGLHQLVATIYVSCCLDRTETLYDDFAPQFEEIVARIRLFYGRESTKNKTGFSNEVAVLPMLAFVVAKCRIHRVRLDALALIRNSRFREGPWDGTSLSNAMLGLMRLEGQDNIEGTSAAMPTLHSRWVWTNMFWDFEKRQMSIEYTKVLPDEMGEFEKRSWVCNEEFRWE